jgi:hypothetical protein
MFERLAILRGAKARGDRKPCKNKKQEKYTKIKTKIKNTVNYHQQ